MWNKELFPVFTTQHLALYYQYYSAQRAPCCSALSYLCEPLCFHIHHTPLAHAVTLHRNHHPFFLTDTIPPNPSILAAPLGRLIASVPGGGGSCHISNLAFPPPDKSYISPSFNPLSPGHQSLSICPHFSGILFPKNLYSLKKSFSLCFG